MSYGERLLALIYAYDREIKDLLFFFKAVHGYIDIDVYNYVTFNDHPRTPVASQSVVILLFRPVRPATCKLHILSVL